MIGSLKNSFLYIQKTMPTEYHDEIEFLGIKNYLYASVLNYLKNEQMPSKKDITEVVNWFTSEYPRWYKNKYFHSCSSSDISCSAKRTGSIRFTVRKSKNSVIAGRFASWRGNPFPKISRFYTGFRGNQPFLRVRIPTVVTLLGMTSIFLTR